MFYSHQLLARKAPLGQIWMAATMHAKINRKKLRKLDLIKICEEILNPSVPMALRLSGILMGGVVIVYERKVKLLYDDVSRLLVEINEAWKAKAVPDPTVLPKGKTHARYEAVTLPDNGDVELEHSMSFSVAAEEFPRKRLRMRLDDLDEDYVNINPDDVSEQHHQADAANITLLDDLGSIFQQEDLNKRFERFDIEEDGEAHISLTPIDERRGVPSTLVPSPPPPPDPLAADDGTTTDPHMEDQEQRQMVEKQPRRHEKDAPVSEEAARRRGPAKRKGPRLVMDEGLLVIKADVYQAWLMDASDIVSKRPRQHHKPTQCRTVSELMRLPPLAIIDGLLDKMTGQICYPEHLQRLLEECSKAHPEGGSPARPRGPPTHSRTGGLYAQDVAFADIGSETDSRTMEASTEKLRAMDSQGVGDMAGRDVFATPESPGRSGKSAPSSGSGPSSSFLPPEPEVRLPSGRSKRRQHSSSNNHLGNLDPVEEEMPFEQNMRDFQLRRESEDGPTLDLGLNSTELLEETGPEQTPNLVTPKPAVDKITQTVRTRSPRSFPPLYREYQPHLKTHFDTPGAPDSESLNLLAAGMNKKRAAQLFYQTCVLATLDFVKVEQTYPYGDILVSRGPKM